MLSRRLRTRNAKIAAAVAGLFLLATSGLLAPFGNLAASVLSPIASPFNAVGRSVGSWLDPRGDEALEGKLLKLRNQRSREQLQFENEQLRGQLEFAQQTDFEFVGAEVVGYQPDSVRAGITINRGERDGVTPGMAIVNEGFLVGTVSEVEASRSTVMLVTDPNFRLQALTREHRAKGIVKGELGATVSLTSVVQNDRVEMGNTVVSSGSAGQFPPNITIGEVVEVEPKLGTVFQTARIAPGSSLTGLSFVLVITGGY